MKQTQDPPRLKLELDVATEGALKDALSALESGAPSAESMARMGRRLSSVQAAPVAHGLSLLNKAGVLLVIATGGWLAWRAMPNDRRPAPAAPASAALPSAGGSALPMPQAPAPSAAPTTARSSANAASVHAAADRAPSTKRSAPRRPITAGAQRGAISAEHPPAPIAEVHEDSAASVPEPQAAPQQPATNIAASSSDAASVAAARDPVAPEPPALDEAALLQRARARAKNDPVAALRLVTEHERRFPSGMLVQERELLAVELLHALSREPEARARLQAFRTRFPDSIYLRRAAPPR